MRADQGEEPAESRDRGVQGQGRPAGGASMDKGRPGAGESRGRGVQGQGRPGAGASRGKATAGNHMNEREPTQRRHSRPWQGPRASGHVRPATPGPCQLAAALKPYSDNAFISGTLPYGAANADSSCGEAGSVDFVKREEKKWKFIKFSVWE